MDLKRLKLSNYQLANSFNMITINFMLCSLSLLVELPLKDKGHFSQRKCSNLPFLVEEAQTKNKMNK